MAGMSRPILNHQTSLFVTGTCKFIHSFIGRTSTGCELAAARPGERGVAAEQIGDDAAAELAEDLASGACVDRWWAASAYIYKIEIQSQNSN